VNEPTLVHQVRFSQLVLLKNLENISDEQSLLEPEAGGNSLNWVVGHVCHSRNAMVHLLRGAGHLPDEALAMYRSGTDFDPQRAIGLGMLVTHHAAMQQQIIDGLTNLEEERFRAPAPFSPTNDPGETVGSLMTKLVAHELYHAGQAGLLRRLLGLQGAIGAA
jgi:uncharacterized damage-inducible protein DinB